MSDFLPGIKLLKQAEVASKKVVTPLRELKARLKDLPLPRDFRGALRQNGISLIAEIKKSSPSVGVIRERFNPEALAKTYQAAGAVAVSVLTEKEFFGGELAHLSLVRQTVTLPVLRKDFIINEYQVYESRVAGADAVLLISELLTDGEIVRFLQLSRHLGLDCLLEAHGERGLEKAVSAGGKIIGVNNRDLNTFKIDVQTGLNLLPLIPTDRVKVAESGIKSRWEAELLSRAGADALLVGEALMRSEDPAAKIRELTSVASHK